MSKPPPDTLHTIWRSDRPCPECGAEQTPTNGKHRWCAECDWSTLSVTNPNSTDE